jgi:hypothetical protein
VDFKDVAEISDCKQILWFEHGEENIIGDGKEKNQKGKIWIS